MGMSWENTQPALIRKLKRFGGFTSTESLDRFYEAVITACTQIRRKGDWDWKNATEALVTVAGTLGPYDAPATFHRMALHRKVYLYGFSDTQGQILAPILETDSARFDVIYRVEDGKLWFRQDPGTGTLTFNFVATIDNNPTEANAQVLVESMPGNFFDILVKLIEADFLDESPDTKMDSIAMLNKAEVDLEKEYQEFLKGKPRQMQRSPRGMDGMPFDGLGQQTSIHKRNAGRYPRGGGYR